MVTLKERNWKIHIRRTAKHTGSGNEKEKKKRTQREREAREDRTRECEREDTKRVNVHLY